MSEFDYKKYLKEGKLVKENKINISTLKKEIEEACNHLEKTSNISPQTIEFIRKKVPEFIDNFMVYSTF